MLRAGPHPIPFTPVGPDSAGPINPPVQQRVPSLTGGPSIQCPPPVRATMQGCAASACIHGAAREDRPSPAWHVRRRRSRRRLAVFLLPGVRTGGASLVLGFNLYSTSLIFLFDWFKCFCFHGLDNGPKRRPLEIPKSTINHQDLLPRTGACCN